MSGYREHQCVRSALACRATSIVANLSTAPRFQPLETAQRVDSRSCERDVFDSFSGAISATLHLWKERLHSLRQYEKTVRARRKRSESEMLVELRGAFINGFHHYRRRG